MLIGILILLPRFERVAVLVLILHTLTTFATLFFLPGATRDGFLVPTLEGQYVIKNLVIVALAIGFVAHVAPLADSHRKWLGGRI